LQSSGFRQDVSLFVVRCVNSGVRRRTEFSFPNKSAEILSRMFLVLHCKREGHLYSVNTLDPGAVSKSVNRPFDLSDGLLSISFHIRQYPQSADLIGGFCSNEFDYGCAFK
jgi:hypothetical protein